MKENLAMGMTVPDEVKILPDPYDIEKVFEDARVAKIGEPKKMVAWWDGYSLRLASSVEEMEALPKRVQIETSVTASGVSHAQVSVPVKPRFGLRCVAINAGDGFKPLQLLELEYTLRKAEVESDAPSQIAQPQPWQGPHADLYRWLAEERYNIANICEELTKIDPKFANSKAEHDSRNDPHGWQPDEEIPHTMKVEIEARAALKRLEEWITRQSWLPSAAQSTGSPYGFAPLIISIAKSAHYAGLKVQELRSIAASFRTLSTLGAQKAVVRKSGARAEFILENDAQLTEQNGQKPSTKELMRHLDGKIDPESGQKIYSYEDEDGTRMIQWSDANRQTVNQFAVKIAALRKRKSKKVH